MLRSTSTQAGTLLEGTLPSNIPDNIILAQELVAGDDITSDDNSSNDVVPTQDLEVGVDFTPYTKIFTPAMPMDCLS